MRNEFEKRMIERYGQDEYATLMHDAASYKKRGYNHVQVIDEEEFFDYADDMGWELSGGYVLLPTDELRDIVIEIMGYEYGPRVGLVTISYN